MNKRKKLVALAIVFSICSTSIATENKKVTCDDVLSACLEYTKDLEDRHSLLKTIIEKQNDKIKELSEKADSPAWYWYFIGGVIGGIAITKTLK